MTRQKFLFSSTLKNNNSDEFLKNSQKKLAKSFYSRGSFGLHP